MKNQSLSCVLLFSILLLALAPGFANAKQGNNRPDNAGHQNHQRGDDLNVDLQISIGDRERISNYIRKDVYRNCPPGLAKKNPPCIPPGQAKKWRMGYPLPDDVVFYPVPYEWGLRAPAGYQYVRVDKDVLLVGEASKKVIDAVTLLSAVGN